MGVAHHPIERSLPPQLKSPWRCYGRPSSLCFSFVKGNQRKAKKHALRSATGEMWLAQLVFLDKCANPRSAGGDTPAGRHIVRSMLADRRHGVRQILVRSLPRHHRRQQLLLLQPPRHHRRHRHHRRQQLQLLLCLALRSATEEMWLVQLVFLDKCANQICTGTDTPAGRFFV